MPMQVQTDRTWYLAGEALTVSVTADDALIAYAELCDTHGLAAGVVMSLTGGRGTGIIELPSTLHSGYYQLSVYTRHDVQVTHRLVAVVNPLSKSADDDIEWVKVNHPDSLSYPAVVSSSQASGFISNYHSSFFKLQTTRETEGHIITARIKNVYGGHAYSGNQIRASLSIIGKQIHYFEGKMVNDSTAVFYTYGIHGRLPLVLSARTSTGISLPVGLVSPFAGILPNQLPRLVFHYNRPEMERRSLDMQRMARSREQEARSEGLGTELLEYDETVLGSKPDLSYNLDEYRQFLTVREVLLEYVSCVKKTTRQGVSQLIVRKEHELYNNALSTLVLIDGMPVFDTDRLLNYDARRIHYINIYGGLYTFGQGTWQGILSFVTRSGRLTNYPTESDMQYLEYVFP